MYFYQYVQPRWIRRSLDRIKRPAHSWSHALGRFSHFQRGNLGRVQIYPAQIHWLQIVLLLKLYPLKLKTLILRPWRQFITPILKLHSNLPQTYAILRGRFHKFQRIIWNNLNVKINCVCTQKSCQLKIRTWC